MYFQTKKNVISMYFQTKNIEVFLKKVTIHGR